ncbi:MAG: endonuclease domain-containing protein [Bacteroidota bacterium]
MGKNKFKTIERAMFFGASPLIFRRACELRENTTEAEKHLWQYLKSNQILNLRFKQQHPINHFIVDFYCHKIKLVVEVDGEIHLSRFNKEYDESRTFEFEKCGITVIRFTNEEVLNNINYVISVITNRCNELLISI